MKKSTVKPKYTTRIDAPIAKNDAKGKPALFCPFCKPTHPLVIGADSLCGTRLEVRAVQMVFRAKYEKDMKCAKCGQGGGEMVMFQNAFIHINDCMPGVATLTVPPKYSWLAKTVFKFPPKIKTFIEKRMGHIMPVDEVDPDGTRTGNTLGYFFYKG